MRGLGTNGKLLMGAEVEIRAEPFEIFINAPLNCKKTPLLDIKMHPIFDRIGFLLYDIIH